MARGSWVEQELTSGSCGVRLVFLLVGIRHKRHAKTNHSPNGMQYGFP